MKILIADDHAIVRKGLKQILLEEFSSAEILEVENGNQLLKEIRKQNFDVVISDLSMPGLSGLDALKQLKEEFPKQPVLILSMHPEDQYAIRVLRAGASGYLNKETAGDELVKAVRQITGGKRYISPAVAEKLAENLDIDSSKALHETLSDREFEVLKLIATGKTVSDVAGILSLSVATISTYRARLLEKLHLKNNAELTRYALDNNMV
jgi:two-component system invasion response regulator UvrY